jgi:shikimate dehydrogenase
VISGATRVAAVIGEPVRHSLSPVLHNAAYRALALDWVFVAFEVPDGAARRALDGMRTFGLVGMAVTMPHKSEIAAACDTCTPDAELLRSVNTVTALADGTLAGDSTDGAGFLRSLEEHGHDPAGRTVLVLGAGGAARAVGLALVRAGASVTVTARRPDAAETAAVLIGAAAQPWDSRDAAVAASDIVVNATPVGMSAGELPIAGDVLGAGQVFADLVYHPLETALLQAARERGAAVVDGLGMLVHQAALQIERWSGHPAPLAEMRHAVLDHLSRS